MRKPTSKRKQTTKRKSAPTKPTRRKTAKRAVKPMSLVELLKPG